MMLCGGEGYSWEQDSSSATNSDIVAAFSPSNDLRLHCIINTADRELFVVAGSCRNAKILSVYHGHLQAIGCGRCSCVDLKRFTEQAPEEFAQKLPSVLEGGEPKILWPAGYISDQIRRRAKDRMDRMIAGLRE